MSDELQRKDEDDDETETPDAVGVKRAREILGDLVLRAGYGNERIVLMRHGKPAAALVGMKDLERLRRSDAA